MAEEQHYLQQYQRGDMEAKTILIERNLRLVAHVVKKYQGADVELDDLISIGTIGLMKAISTFDPGKTTRLSTYAARCIDNELLMMFRTRKKHSREVSLYEPIGTDKEGNEISLLDVMEGPAVDVVEEYSTRESIRHVLGSMKTVLTEKEYEVICCRFGLFGKENRHRGKSPATFTSAAPTSPESKKTPCISCGRFSLNHNLRFTAAENIINLDTAAKIYKQLLLRMGSALCGIALLIIDRLHRNHHIGSIRLHDLDGLSHSEFISLCNLNVSSLVNCFRKAKIGVSLLVGIVVIDLGFLVRLAVEEACGEFTVGTACDLLLIPGHIGLVFGWILQIVVNGLPVGTGNSGNIKGCFHAALDLQAVNSAGKHIIHMLDHAKILRVENIGTTLILINRHVLPWS